MSEGGFWVGPTGSGVPRRAQPGAVLASWLAPTTESRVEEIDVDLIDPPGWRPAEDPADPGYRALKASVRASGILQPLLLRPGAQGRYQVVSGARRLRAARETGQGMVPAVVRELGDLEALIGGWDAVLRTGLTDDERREMVERLLGAGMAAEDATALVASVPHRESGPAPMPADTGAVGVAVEPAAEPVAEPAETAGAVPVEATPQPVVEERPCPAVTEVGEPALEEAAEVPVPAAVTAVEVVAAEEPPAGWPAPAQAPWVTGDAPPRPGSPLPLDPSTFSLGPLPPLDGGSFAAQAEAATVGTGRATAAPAEAEPLPTPEVEPPTVTEVSATPTVIPIVLPHPAVTEPMPTPAEPPVEAPAVPPEVAASGVTPVPVRLERPASLPVTLPEEPVPAFPTGEPREGLAALRVAATDPRTVATTGVAIGVGAAVFLIVAVLLGAGAGRPLVIAAVVAVFGFVLAIVSLALPRHEL